MLCAKKVVVVGGRGETMPLEGFNMGKFNVSNVLVQMVTFSFSMVLVIYKILFCHLLQDHNVGQL